MFALLYTLDTCSRLEGFCTRIRGAQDNSKPAPKEAKSTLFVFINLLKFACYPRMRARLNHDDFMICI
jgi:hypothetical protein